MFLGTLKKNRNHLTKLKSTSMRLYVVERCSQINERNLSIYWKTIKPFMTHKMKIRHDVFTLQHNGNILLSVKF